MNKITLGISSCLLGNLVRYDGRHKLNEYITTFFGRYFDLLPVCPEVESGLSIPREPMVLEGDIDNPILITQTTRIDLTQHMLTWSKTRCDQLVESKLRGFIFKSKSPSCGLFGVEIFNQTGDPLFEGRGLFAETFIRRFYMLPVIDEVSIEDTNSRKTFIEHVFVIDHWLSECSTAHPRSLQKFHERFAGLLMSYNNELFQKCCQLISQIDSYPFDHIIENYQETLLKILSSQTTVRSDF